MINSEVPAGWYQDPQNQGMQRYWNGFEWTQETRMPTPPGPPGGMMTGNLNQGPPENYLVWSILATLFCFWPIGIFAIINAAKVESAWSRGQYEASMEASKKAKKFSIISAIVGPVIFVVIYLLIFIVAIGTTVTQIQ